MIRFPTLKLVKSYKLDSLLMTIVFISLAGCQKTTQTTLVSDLNDYNVQVMQLESASARSEKVFTGKLQSTKTAGVSFRVPGTIQKIFVKTGDSVVKGQLLAQLDPHDYQVVLEELEAKALEAKSAHKLAKNELSRVKQAISDNAIASVNLDRAISGYERSESAVKVS